jgi:hypothetical protein
MVIYPVPRRGGGNLYKLYFSVASLCIVKINPFRPRPSHSANDSQSLRFSTYSFRRSAISAGPGTTLVSPASNCVVETADSSKTSVYVPDYMESHPRRHHFYNLSPLLIPTNTLWEIIVVYQGNNTKRIIHTFSGHNARWFNVNPLKTKRICFILGLSAYRAVNTPHFGYKNQSLNVL